MKKIISILLSSVLLVVSLFAFASCGGDGNTGDGGNGGGNGDGGDNGGGANTDVTYTITVKDEDGNAISGVSLSLTNSAGLEYYNTLDVTDAEGKTSIKMKSDSQYTNVKLKSAPSRYAVDKSQVYTFTNNAVTITLTSHPSYTVKVVDQNGDAVVGAKLQMCNDAGCVPLDDTDEGGESVRYIDKTGFRAQLTEHPSGYEYAEGENDATYYDFSGDSDSGYIVTIEVKKVN